MNIGTISYLCIMVMILVFCGLYLANVKLACDMHHGMIVRGLWGLECIKNRSNDGEGK